MQGTNILDLWRAATARSICRGRNCRDCNEIYGIVECPAEIDVSPEEMGWFVKKVNELLEDYDNKCPFPMEMTDEEFLSILNQATTVD